MENYIKGEFTNPSAKYRGAPFWAWNTKIEKQTVSEQVEIFKEMGFGGFHIHSRVGLDTKYLGDGFFELVELSVKRGKELGLFTYLYDEDRWPSGFAGGEVTRNIDYRLKHLLFTNKSYEELGSCENEYYQPNFATGKRTGNGVLFACYDIVLNEYGELKEYSQIEESGEYKGEKSVCLYRIWRY